MRSSEGDRIEVVGYSDVRVDGLLAWWFFSCVGDTNDLSEKLAVDFFLLSKNFSVSSPVQRWRRPGRGGDGVGGLVVLWWVGSLFTGGFH